MLALLLAAVTLAPAATLPGIALPFDVDATGAWVLPATLPSAFAAAGVQPGWSLVAVDGLKLAADPAAAQRIVAAGPARPVRLHFATPEGETIVVVPRGPLVVVEDVGLLPWPAGFAPAPGPAAPVSAPGSSAAPPIGRLSWTATGDGVPRVTDGTGAEWALDTVTGAQVKADGVGDTLAIPEVWWALSDAPWVVLGSASLTTGDHAWARTTLAPAARLPGFQGQAGDHLAVARAEGLQVYTVTWPQGTPELPICVPDVPESCLVAGRHVAATLLERPGGRAEALRDFGVACEGGTYRACLEAVGLRDATLASRAAACAERDVNACHEVARAQLGTGAEDPSALTVGVLEYACAVDASGSLGERLRRLEDVGEGCMLLSAAFDRQGVGDRALISLDQACLLGRADACETARVRRQDAFALRTIRECEDPELPIASACTQLGGLLQAGPIAATTLDGFGAYLRGCQQGDEQGCVRLGDYVDRWGITHGRVVKAEQALLQSCESGKQRACVGAAHLLVRHEPRSDAYAQALTLFAAACDSGLPSACIAGAEQRRIGAARGGDAPEPEELWRRACELDSAPGCAGLGERLARAKGTVAAAYTAWTQACDTGEAGACTDLGRIVEVRHDPPWPGEEPAPAYFARGCENGDAEGCFQQAAVDVPKRGDPPEPAYLLLGRACAGDYGPACAELGRVHLQRETSFDDEIAAGHLQRACDNGQFESCKVLAGMYLSGTGVEKDRAKARELAQRYSTNARRKLVRAGLRLGFPSLAGGEAELVVPIPVGPALAVSGAYSWVPGVGGILVQLEGDSYPDDPLDYRYADAGVRLYPNNKARGLYGMVGVHQIEASGPTLATPLTRAGFSGRIGIYSESKVAYTRVEMGIGQYGMIHLEQFDEDQTGSFPLLQATLGFSMGLAIF